MFRLRRPAAQLVQQESASRTDVVQQQSLPDEDQKSDPAAEAISPELDFSSLGFVIDAAAVCTENSNAGHSSSLSHDQTLAVRPNMNLDHDLELLSPVSTEAGFNGASCASDESEKPPKLSTESSSTGKVSAAASVRDIVHDVAHAGENSSEDCGIRMVDEDGFHARRCLPISTPFDVSNQLASTAFVNYSNNNFKEEQVHIVSVSGNDISRCESQDYADVDTDVDDGLNSAPHSGQSIRLSNGFSAETPSFDVPVSSADIFEINLTGDPFPREINDANGGVDELTSAVGSGDAAQQHSPLSDMLNEIRLAGQYSYTENQTRNSMPAGHDLIENCAQDSSVAELPTADGSDDTLLSCELDISEFPSEIIDEQLMRTDDSNGMVFDVSGALITDDDDDEDVEAVVKKVVYKIIDSISGDAVAEPSAFPASPGKHFADVIAEQDKLPPAATLPAFMRGFLYIVDADDVELVEQTKLFFHPDENTSFHEIRFENSSCAKPIFLSKFFSAFDMSKIVVICRQLRPSSLILWALSASVPIVHPLLLTLTTDDDDDIFVNNESTENIGPAKHWVENWLWGSHIALCRKNITDDFKMDATSDHHDVLWEKFFSLLYSSYPTETLQIVPQNRALFGGRHSKRLFHGWHVMFDCITPMPHAFTTLAGAKRQKLHAKKLVNVLQAVCRDGDAVVTQFASIRQLVNVLLLPSHAAVPNPLVIMLVLTDEQLHKWPMCDVKLLRQILCKASESSVSMQLFQCMQFIVVKPDFFESLLYRSYKTRHELYQFVADFWRNFCPAMLLKNTDIDRYLISAPAPTTTDESRSTVPFAFDDEKSTSNTGKYFKMTLDYILECLSTKSDGKCNNAALLKAVILDSLCSSSMPLRQFNAFCMQLTNHLLKQFNSYYNSAESLVDYLIGNAGRVGSATPDTADAGINNNINSNETCRIFAAISLCSSIILAVHQSSRLKNNNSLGAAKIACCVQMWQRLSIPQQVLEASLRPSSSSIFFDADEQRKSADNKSDKPNSVNIASWDKYIVNMATVLFSSSLELLLVSSLTTSTSPLIESDQQQKVRTEQLRNSNLDRFSLHIQAFSATVTLLIALPQRLMPSEKLKHLSFRCCNVLSLALAQKPSPPAAAPAMTYVDLLHFLHSIECHEFRIALCTNLMCARLQQYHHQVPAELSMLFSSSDENKKRSCTAKTGGNLPAVAVMLKKWFAFILQRWQWPTAHALQQHTTVELKNNNSTKLVFVPAVVLPPKSDAEKTLAPAWSVGRRNIISTKAENSTNGGGKKTVLYNAHVAALHKQDYVLFMTILAHLLHHNDDFTVTKIVKDDVSVSCMRESSNNINTTSRSLIADVKTVKTESPTNTKNVAHNDSSIALKPWTGKKQRRIRQAPKFQPQPQPTAINRRGAHVVHNKITSATPRNPMSSPHLRLLLRSVDESRYSLLHRALISAESFTQLLYNNNNSANIIKACQVVEFLMQHDAVVDTLDVYNKSILFYAVKSQIRELLAIALKHVPDALVDIEATNDRICQRMQNNNLHCYADGIMQDAVVRSDERIQLMLIARQLDNDYFNGKIRREFCYDLALALALADGCIMASTLLGGDNNLNTGRELIVDIIRRMRMSITRSNTFRFCAWNLVEHAVIQSMFAHFEHY